MEPINLAKSLEFFSPSNCKERIHVIGCGSVGSTVAELLVRFGLKNIYLYDFDHVEPHNIANQMFRQEHIGQLKTEALKAMLEEINPEVEPVIQLFSEGYSGQKLSGHVFLAVDNIDLRRQIVTSNKGNLYIKSVFDFRTGLTDAQHYAADWQNTDHVKNLINSMQFSHEEAKESTPVSACNVELSVAPTIRVICSLGVTNFINFINKGSQDFKTLIIADPFHFTIDSF